MNAAIEHLAVIDEGDRLFHPGQGIDVELEIFDPPQGVPFLDDVTLCTINGYVKSHAADEIAIDGVSSLTDGISPAKEGLKIRADLDRGALPDREQRDEETGSDNGAAVTAGQSS